MRSSSNKVIIGIVLVVLAYLALLVVGLIPSAHPEGAAEPVKIELRDGASAAAPPTEKFVPAAWAVLPFVALLLVIAVFPLIPATQHWWEHNRNRFLIALLLAVVALSYYVVFHPGGLANHFTHHESSRAGIETATTVFSNAVFTEYIPFIILLFCLYTISGGINLRGDLPAHPATNCAFLAIGTALASFIGTTGAAMLLIRPLIATISERKYKAHTVIFFIFMVCNCGGLLLPIGDPPLFLGYLMGVPFTWTLSLWPYWAGTNLVLLGIYFAWDQVLYSREPLRAIVRDEVEVLPLRLSGKFNIVLIAGIVACVAFVVPGKVFPGTHFVTPNYLREALMLCIVAISLRTTPSQVRIWNGFNYSAIVEVAALFFGIFICMQAPIEILNLEGSRLGIDTPFAFFWATGALSSFLDNAPTYVVFFETAVGLPVDHVFSYLHLSPVRNIMEQHLAAISLGAVLMGANTYIGNGPNFMVKSIAEQSGIKMPSFFGYMAYSVGILIPVFAAISFLL
ncbi:MAG: sodium:proton antiporter [Acidobacteriota bacterium]|nr:MAG: sodium:proton antiporter [Acidobacteriota bacterium]